MISSTTLKSIISLYLIYNCFHPSNVCIVQKIMPPKANSIVFPYIVICVTLPNYLPDFITYEQASKILTSV